MSRVVIPATPVLPSNSQESTWKFTSQIPPSLPPQHGFPFGRAVPGLSVEAPLPSACSSSVLPLWLSGPSVLSLKPPGKGQPGMGSQLPRKGICEPGGPLDIPTASMVRVIRGAWLKAAQQGSHSVQMRAKQGQCPKLEATADAATILYSALCTDPCSQTLSCFYSFPFIAVLKHVEENTHTAVHT